MPLRNKLLALRAKNLDRHQANAPLCQKIHNQNGVPTIYLYDVIDTDPYWGFTPKQLVEMLAEIGDTAEINLRIDSPGGDVFAARTMHTLLTQNRAQVNVFIDGLAASAATYLALAGEKRVASEGAFWMIHNAWTIAVGDRNDFTDIAANLEQIDQSIANDYAKVVSAEMEQIKQWMDAETWFNAADAKTHGFITDIYTPQESKNSAWDLTPYNKAPEIKAPENNNNPEPEPINKVPEKYKRRAALINTLRVA